MLIFSAGAKHMIDQAVAALSNPLDRDAWVRWSIEHPEVRTPKSPALNETEPMPKHVVSVVLGALEKMSLKMQERRAAFGVSEDELSELDNDITFIRSIEAEVYTNM